jgi:hypothetical protein
VNTRQTRWSPNTANHLWELSSFSEAAKAAVQATYSSAAPPLSQASQLPHLISIAGEYAPDAMVPITTNHLWELSSFSEAAKAAAQATYSSAVPSPSQASQLPHLD